MRRVRLSFLVAILLVPVALVLCVSAGSVPIPPERVALAIFGSGEGTDSLIVWLRLSRCLMALAVGAGLAVSGCAYQGMFGNPLADPYVIGSSSGAALGAVATMAILATGTGKAFFGVGTGAFLGSALAVAMSYAVSRSLKGGRSSISLLLAGTAVGSMFSAVTTLILTLNDRQLHPAFFWMLGGLTGADSRDLAFVIPAVGIGTLLLCLSSRALDVLSQGDEEALALGLSPGRARVAIGAVATFVVASAVSVSGTIGFIGLVAPHIARRFTGPAHRLSMPFSALSGALLLLLSDTLARTAFAPIEIPVGAITSCVGAPFFLFLLARGAWNGGSHA